MAFIKIFTEDGLEIDFKKDSLTLKKENNAFSSDFKVPHSVFPFLIIENENTKKAFGSSDITSISKNKVIPVIVIEEENKFYGELEQIKIIGKFRKCNLKYSSDLLKVFNLKINNALPSISVTGNQTNIVPYAETMQYVLPNMEDWNSFGQFLLGKIFPEVKLQLPKMKWQDKFGTNIPSGEPWHNYLDYVNNVTEYAPGQFAFILNSIFVDGIPFSNNEKNVPMPQVFLLSPLFYILETIGWTFSGDFTEHELIRRTLFFSEKNNLYKTPFGSPGYMHTTIDMNRYVPEWTFGTYITNLKNAFNLNVKIDDIKKDISFNFNENSNESEEKVIIEKSLLYDSYDVAAFSSFVLKYQNDEDIALFITKEEQVIYDDIDNPFTKTIASKFKYMNSDATTTVITEDLVNKEGVGLLIYNENNKPYTSTATPTGYNLNINGVKGIYETFFKRWLKFCLNASSCEVTGYFTKQELKQIVKSSSVYINNQHFRVVDVTISEASNNFEEAKISLLSVNY
jgi:hypothetical protein